MRYYLHPSYNKKGNRKYAYYHVARAFRNEEGKPRIDLIEYLGALSEKEVQHWRLKLKLMGDLYNGKVSDFCRINELKFVDSRRYLDVAIFNHIYDSLGLNKIFYFASDKDVGTHDVAKILNLSRCLDPQANYRTVDWFKDSYLPELMGTNPEKYNKDKIFHELANIHKKRKFLQKHFYELSKEWNKGEFEIYFFDGTTSYFEGTCCPLAEAAKDKTAGFQDKVILICLVTDKKGFPVMWDVFSGNRRDIKEFKKIAEKMAMELGVKEVTFCFDRGVASVTNFDIIEDKLKSKYISGLDQNQIGTVFDVDGFADTTRPRLVESYEKSKTETAVHREPFMPTNGFYKYAHDRFYKELGEKVGSRHVVSFNVQIYEKEQKNRLEHIGQVKRKIAELNEGLLEAKEDRNAETVFQKVDELLKKYKLTKVFEYSVLPIAVTFAGKAVQTHKVTYSISNEALKEKEKYDGLLVYITDHTQKTNSIFNVTASDIVRHYKDKYVIENVFRYIKTFEDLRPFYVYLPEHVQAHVDICMVAYFINNYIYQKLSAIDISLEKFYRIIESHSRVCQLDGGTGQGITLMKNFSRDMSQIIKALGVSAVVAPEMLERLHIQK